MIEILNNKNSINKRSDLDCFSNVYKKFLEKNNSLEIFIFFVELKVISSPGQFVQLPVIKIFNFSGLFSKL